jgi:hypothetical protein
MHLRAVKINYSLCLLIDTFKSKGEGKWCDTGEIAGREKGALWGCADKAPLFSPHQKVLKLPPSEVVLPVRVLIAFW